MIDWDAVDAAYADWVAKGGLAPKRDTWQTSGYSSFTFEDYAPLGFGDFTLGQLESYYKAWYVDPGYVLPPVEKEPDLPPGDSDCDWDGYDAAVMNWGKVWTRLQPLIKKGDKDAEDALKALNDNGGTTHYNALLAHYKVNVLVAGENDRFKRGVDREGRRIKEWTGEFNVGIEIALEKMGWKKTDPAFEGWWIASSEDCGNGPVNDIYQNVMNMWHFFNNQFVKNEYKGSLSRESLAAFGDAHGNILNHHNASKWYKEDAWICPVDETEKWGLNWGQGRQEWAEKGLAVVNAYWEDLTGQEFDGTWDVEDGVALEKRINWQAY